MQINQILSNQGDCSVFCKLLSKNGRCLVAIKINSRGGTVDFEADRENLGSIADQLKKADELLHNDYKQ